MRASGAYMTGSSMFAHQIAILFSLPLRRSPMHREQAQGENIHDAHARPANAAAVRTIGQC
jgi:hypothetical protein